MCTGGPASRKMLVGAEVIAAEVKVEVGIDPAIRMEKTLRMAL